MDLTDLRNAFARLKALTTERRALRMRLLVGRKRMVEEIDDVLLVQSVDPAACVWSGGSSSG